MIIAELLSL